MNRSSALSVLLAACVTACSGRIDRAESMALRGLHAVGTYADDAVQDVVALREARMRACMDAEDRRACMGPLAKPIAPTVEKIRDAYDQAVRAIRAMARAARELERMREVADVP